MTESTSSSDYSYSNENRQSSVAITLSNGDTCEDLVFAGLTGEEAIGQPFCYVLTLYTQDSGYASVPTTLSDDVVQTMIGANITVTLVYDPGDDGAGTRYFNGYCQSFAWVRQVGSSGVSEYEAIIVPHVSMLKHNQVYRIFKNQTVYEILDTLFSSAGLGSSTDYSFSVDESDMLTLDMVVQYGESDFDFMQRLLESYGLTYIFDHQETYHTMVIIDINYTWTSIFTYLEHDSEDDEVENQPVSYLTSAERAMGKMGIWTWRTQQNMTPVQTGGRMYDWQNASSVQSTTLRDVFDDTPDYASDLDWMIKRQYPLGHLGAETSTVTESNWDGTTHAKYEAYRIKRKSVYRIGRSNLRFINTGYYFNLSSHPVSSENQNYYITRMKFEVGTEQFPLGGAERVRGGNEDKIFMCELEGVPVDVPYVPDLNSPAPVIAGVQSATVVYGDSEVSVDTDEFGRVLVQFPWNDEDVNLSSTDSDAQDESSNDSKEQYTAYVRVSQFWAGSNRGALFTPRVGDEVLIAFEFGDPSQPMIVGSVYNGNNPPFITPSNLPQVSGIRTRIVSSASTDLEDDYQGIQYSDLLFDDLDSSETRGLQLRSFSSSAGSDYDFGGEEGNTNYTDHVVGLTIHDSSDSEETELNLGLNVGKDVIFQMVGDQSEASNVVSNKKAKLRVGGFTQTSWNTYSTNIISTISRLNGFYKAEVSNPINYMSVGPFSSEIWSLRRTVSLKSGIPSEDTDDVSTSSYVANWVSVAEDLWSSDEDESMVSYAESYVAAETISDFISSNYSDSAEEISTTNYSLVATTPNNVQISSTDADGQNTTSYYYYNAMKTEVTDSSDNVSLTQQSASQWTGKIYSADDGVNGYLDFNASNYNLSLADGKTKMRASDEYWDLSVAQEAGKIVVNDSYVYASAASADSSLILSGDYFSTSVSSASSTLVLAESSAMISTNSSGAVVALDSSSISLEATNIGLEASASVTIDGSSVTANGGSNASSASSSASSDQSSADSDMSDADGQPSDTGDSISSDAQTTFDDDTSTISDTQTEKEDNDSKDTDITDDDDSDYAEESSSEDEEETASEESDSDDTDSDSDSDSSDDADYESSDSDSSGSSGSESSTIEDSDDDDSDSDDYSYSSSDSDSDEVAEYDDEEEKTDESDSDNDSPYNYTK